MMLGAARAEMRNKFEESRSETDPSVIAQRTAEGLEADEFIKHHIVQAKRDGSGQYVASVDGPGSPMAPLTTDKNH